MKLGEQRFTSIQIRRLKASGRSVPGSKLEMESTDVEKAHVVPGEKASWSDLEKESVNTDDAQRKLILNQNKKLLSSK